MPDAEKVEDSRYEKRPASLPTQYQKSVDSLWNALEKPGKNSRTPLISVIFKINSLKF